MDVKVDNYQENVYEVSLLINVEAKANGEKAFIIELDYAGLFTVIRPEEELEKILLIVCPNILFPFARRIIANASQDGSLPPLMLHPIDFVSLYESRKLEQSES
jgi:preprotein translocase subunit SecB